jgi:5-methylcytosine-specific restriction protein B
MSERNYWVISPNVKNNDEEDAWKECICKSGWAYMGYWDDHPIGKTFQYDIKKGDCILVAQGANNNKRLFIAGIVENDAGYYDPEKDDGCDDMPSEAWGRKLNPWIPKERLNSLGIEFNEKAGYGTSRQIKALYKLKTNNDVDTEICKILEKEFRRIKMTEKYKLALTILAERKNIILTGAPGTGKTYATSEIAVALCDGADKVPQNRGDIMKRYKKLIKAGQITFTTFHQSLDYEEFVEGLKPNCDDAEHITYEVKPGIFKRIAKQALKESYSGTVDNFDEVWEKFLNDILENKEISIPSTSPGTSIRYGLSTVNSLKFLDLSAGTLTKQNIYDAYRELKSRPSGAFQSYMNAVVKYLQGEYGLNPYKPGVLSQLNDVKPYVLIIDEINRGNISKIFGELITLLEKDKRLGKENEIAVTLPYSQETFGVPPNLYIIGTMNTADRSIGQIDYALRRRFAFVPLQSDGTVIDNYDKYQGGAKQKALDLFDAINNFLKEDGVVNGDLEAEDLMLGHSYFLCSSVEELKRRLDYEIIPLIKEYEKDGIIMSDKEKIKAEIERWEKTL